MTHFLNLEVTDWHVIINFNRNSLLDTRKINRYDHVQRVNHIIGITNLFLSFFFAAANLEFFSGEFTDRKIEIENFRKVIEIVCRHFAIEWANEWSFFGRKWLDYCV